MEVRYKIIKYKTADGKWHQKAVPTDWHIVESQKEQSK